MSDCQPRGKLYAHAALIAVLSLTTWALLSDGLERFVSLATDEFYLHPRGAPDWAMQVTTVYLMHPVLILWYLPAVAALAICVSLVRRRAKTLTLRTIFLSMTIVCMTLAFMSQSQREFYTMFPIFVIVHTSLSIGLTIWLVRELRMLLEALSKVSREQATLARSLVVAEEIPNGK